MTTARRIGLGTVQFGMPYGVTNSGGQVSKAEARRIVQLARASGIETIDTASLYGESEAVLGRSGIDDFQVVTKTAKLQADGNDAAALLIDSFARSLHRLRRQKVYGLLVHEARDLLGQDGRQLWEAMEELRARGHVDKIGVSAYDGETVDAVCDRFPVQIVQIPFNPLDRRLAEGGQLERLAAAGVEIHARSLFLQGILLQDANALPTFLRPLGARMSALHAQFAAAGLSKLEGVLAMAFQTVTITRFICGVTSVADLQAIVFAAEKAQHTPCDIALPDGEALNPRLLNPACWPDLAQQH